MLRARAMTALILFGARWHNGELQAQAPAQNAAVGRAFRADGVTHYPDGVIHYSAVIVVAHCKILQAG